MWGTQEFSMSLGLLGYNGCGELIFVDLLIKVWIVISFRRNAFCCLFLAPTAEIESEKIRIFFKRQFCFWHIDRDMPIKICVFTASLKIACWFVLPISMFRNDKCIRNITIYVLKKSFCIRSKMFFILKLLLFGCTWKKLTRLLEHTVVHAESLPWGDCTVQNHEKTSHSCKPYHCLKSRIHCWWTCHARLARL